MRRATIHSTPELEALARLAASLRRARRRRRLTQDDMALRMAVSRSTYRALEQGNPGVSMGLLLRALFVLGYPERLGSLLDHDPIGDDLDDAYGPKRVRSGLADF